MKTYGPTRTKAMIGRCMSCICWKCSSATVCSILCTLMMITAIPISASVLELSSSFMPDPWKISPITGSPSREPRSCLCAYLSSSFIDLRLRQFTTFSNLILPPHCLELKVGLGLNLKEDHGLNLKEDHGLSCLKHLAPLESSLTHSLTPLSLILLSTTSLMSLTQGL